MTGNIRIKVSLSVELKTALETVAAYMGMPLSRLLVEAAVDRYLLRKSELPKDLGLLCDRLGALERQLARLEQPRVAAPVVEPPKAPKRARKSVLDPVKQVLPGPAPSALTDLDRAIAEGKPVHVDRLLLRLSSGKPDQGLKARLSQLGGRDGKLFQGDITRANRVAEVTSRLDPDGLSWLPVDSERRFWRQMTALEYCKAILVTAVTQQTWKAP